VPCLFDVSGPQKALCCEIEKGGAVLGRDQRVCKVVFPADAPGISRIHCNVRYNEQTGVFLLEDMGSSFGTFAENGEQIYPGKIKVLENNQRFYLAQRSNMFCVGFKEDTK
ncbi:MAG: FHA domain-containing protein, partial [Clostridia bacterium]|nr:FHA domain-containing protein [Clostridia bacterium]